MEMVTVGGTNDSRSIVAERQSVQRVPCKMVEV